MPERPFHNFRALKTGDRKLYAPGKRHSTDFKAFNMCMGRSGCLHVTMCRKPPTRPPARQPLAQAPARGSHRGIRLARLFLIHDHNSINIAILVRKKRDDLMTLP